MSSMKIQATIAGFNGSPITLLGLHHDTGVLVIQKEVKYRETRIAEDFAVISNLDLPDMDFAFTDKDLSDAIRAFYTRRAQMMMQLSEKVARYDPDGRIDSDTVTETGRNYKISGDIHNGQMAVLAMIAFVERQKPILIAIDEMEEMTELYRAITI